VNWSRRYSKDQWPEAIREKALMMWIPEHMIEGLTNWILHGRTPGYFLQAILMNDLKEACLRADDYNRTRIWNYVNFLLNESPMNCWGSKEKMERWHELKGLCG
jgi:hypothetical protein